MKYRQSFVTNSSSSSFTCSYCSEHHEGWDISPSDVDGFTCENGHQFCSCIEPLDVDFDTLKFYIIDSINKDIEYIKIDEYYNKDPDKRAKYISDYERDIAEIQDAESENDINLDDYLDYEVPSIRCPICMLQEIEQEVEARYLVKKSGVTRDEVFTLVKNQNKRRKKLYDFEYINYVYQKFGWNHNDILKEIQDKYKSYEELLESL